MTSSTDIEELSNVVNKLITELNKGKRFTMYSQITVLGIMTIYILYYNLN